MTPEAAAQVELPIPEEGLDHVLRSWVGRGQLLKIINCVALEELPRHWRPVDTRLRAGLMLFHKVAPLIALLPSAARQWIDLLPAESRRHRTIAPTPGGGTLWIETRQRYGWPPSAFVVRHRDRVAHELLASVLAWVGSQVSQLAKDAATVDASAVEAVSPQLKALAEIQEIGLIALCADQPRSSELTAVKREGAVWRRLVDLAQELKAAREPAMAAELLRPVEELRPKFFQLGVLGKLLLALDRLGASIVSMAPLSFVTGREQYEVEFGGQVWHLWMEAGASWRRYNASSYYQLLTRPLAAQSRPLSPDLLLILPGRAAFIIECKYSTDAEYIGRTGLAQTLLYMADIGASMASVIEGVVVAPEGVVKDAACVDTSMGRLCLASPDSGIERAVRFISSVTSRSLRIDLADRPQVITGVSRESQTHGKAIDMRQAP